MSAIRSAVALGGLFAVAAASTPVAGQSANPKVRWEYGELYHHGRIGKVTGADKKGFDPLVEWVSGDGAVKAYRWEGMAEKLKAAPAKAEPEAPFGGPDATHRLRVLNHLGGQGWELVTHDYRELNDTARWVFKRQVVR